jgi:DNA-binding MarR family transcriptional regulator
VLATLVDRAYVRRRADPAHGRVIRTELTKAGRAVLAACDGAVGEIEHEMLFELPPKERERLLASLTSCVRTLGAGLADS